MWRAAVPAACAADPSPTPTGNAHDPNAIILTNMLGESVGHVAREDAAVLAPFFDAATMGRWPVFGLWRRMVGKEDARRFTYVGLATWFCFNPAAVATLRGARDEPMR